MSADPLSAAEIQQLRQRRNAVAFLRQQGESLLAAAIEIERALDDQVRAACAERDIDHDKGVTIGDDGVIQQAAT